MNLVAVILSGGRGCRLGPLTETTPKSLLRYNSKPMIDWTLEFVDGRVSTVFVSLGYLAEQVIEHLSVQWPSVQYWQELVPLGTGGALKLFANRIAAAVPDHVFILPADHVREIDLEAWVARHVSERNDLTILTDRPSPENEHLILAPDGRVTDYLMHGQPVMDSAVSAIGEYIFTWPALSKQLSQAPDGPFDLTREVVIPLIASPHTRVGTFPARSWRDLGTLGHYNGGRA